MFSSPLLQVILAGVAFAVLGLSYKMAADSCCRPMAFAAVFLLVAATLAGARACFEPTAWADPHLWVLGAVMGTVLFAALALIVAVNRNGPASVSWTVVNLSLILPIFLSSLLLGEALLAVDAGLVLLFVIMLLALHRSMQGAADEAQGSSRTFWLLLALLFFANGMFQFGSKWKDVLFHANSSAGLATIYFVSGFLLALLAHIARTRSLGITASEWRVGILAGGSAGLGNLLLLHGMSLPAIVAFPVAQGIGLIGGSAITAVVYRERFNPARVVGLVLSMLVLLTAVTREPLDHWLKHQVQGLCAGIASWK